jgi:hypothetical protein
MVSRNRTLADAGALAAGLLVEACPTTSDAPPSLEVVKGLALDLERRLDALSRPEVQQPDSLVEAVLACADLATLAACNLSGVPEDGEPLAAAAVQLSAGAARALAILVEARAGSLLGEAHAENTLRDTRGALWRAGLAARQIEDLRKAEAPG